MTSRTLSTAFAVSVTLTGSAFAEDPLVLGKGKGLFNVGPLLFEDEFKNLDDWVVQLDQGEGFPKSEVAAKEGTLDCLVPGSGCTVWFKEKLQTRIVISYDVLCLSSEDPVKTLAPIQQDEGLLREHWRRAKYDHPHAALSSESCG